MAAAVSVVAAEVVGFVAAVEAASAVAARPFMAVASAAVAQPFMAVVFVAAVPYFAAVFAPARHSIVAAATALPRRELSGIITSGRDAPTSIIATISARATTATRRPIIRSATIIRAGSARWSGPITARARSAAIARGITTTGAFAIACRSIGKIAG